MRRAVRKVQRLDHPANAANAVDIVLSQVRLVDLLLALERGDEMRRAFRQLPDQPLRFVRGDDQGGNHLREQHKVLQRHHRQRIRHLLTLHDFNFQCVFVFLCAHMISCQLSVISH